MGGRTLPYECEHGVTVDWGDFGPCQDCAEHGDTEDCPNFVECPQCEAARHVHQSRDAAERLVVDAAVRWRTAGTDKEEQAWLHTLFVRVGQLLNQPEAGER